MKTARARLQIVAGIFVVWGVLSLLGILRLSQGKIQFSLSFGLLCIPIAIGLFALRSFWRRVAMVVLGVFLGSCAMVAVLVLFQWKNIGIEPFIGISGTAAVVAGAVILICSTALSIWSMRVLRSSSVRELFGESVAQGA